MATIAALPNIFHNHTIYDQSVSLFGKYVVSNAIEWLSFFLVFTINQKESPRTIA